jgi:type VI secretion system protein ImpL
MMLPPLIDPGQPERWLHYKIAALIFAITCGIGFFLRQWWRKRVTNRATGRAMVVRGKETQLGADSLASIWRRFLRGQPWRHRVSILDYPMVVVLGPAGAGKSKLIDTQVDWQAQKKRFFPSVTEDPLLQVYIGSRVIVQELSPALLGDDSAAARRALSRLWRASAAKRAPGVLLVVDALALGNAAPEELRRQAQLLRGKIDLLQELHASPMRVSVCLTHMDSFTGFSELAAVCQRQQLPLATELASMVSAGALAPRDARPARLFGGREEYLALALTAAPAESFNRVVELMASSGGIGSGLSAFVSPLLEKSRLAVPPLLDKLYFFSPGDQVDRVFQAPAPTAGRTTPLRQHVLRLAAVAGLMLLTLGAAHLNHSHRLTDAGAAIAAYEQLAQRGGLAASSAELRTSLERADEALTAMRSSESWWPLLRLSQRLHKRQLAARLVAATRAVYLLPLVRHGSIESRELTLYVLGLLYAAPDNELGQYIAPRSKHWADNLGLPELAVTSYIHWTDHAWTDAVPLASSSESNDPTLSLKPWAEFLAALRAAYESQDVGEDLRQLQTQANALYEALDRSRQFSEVPALLQLLPEHTPVDINAFLSAPHREEALAWIGENRPTLEGLLTMIRQGELSTQVLGRMMVGALVAHVNKLLTAGAGETFALKLQRGYVFSRQRWSELLARASIQVYVRQPGYPFLPREAPAAPDAPPLPVPAANGADPYASAIANAYAAGTASAAAMPAPGVTTGSAATDVYHRPVVEGSVRPALLEFGKLLPASPLPAADKATLAAYLLEQANLYAQRYREALFAEYQPYHVNVRTPRELPGAVTQLIQPTGGFMRWLRAVADDADLGNLDTMYLRPLGDAVAPLQPIVRLLKPPKDGAVGMSGSMGGLSRYVEMITRLSRDLAGTEKPSGMLASASPFMPPPPPPTAEAPAASDEPGGELKAILSPVGRVAMSMLLQPESSYTAQAAQWLEEVGITDDLKRPFLEPFERVLDFGVPEIESALKLQWQKQWNQVSPMFGKFPFRRQASKEVDPAELDGLGEHGNFWKGFRGSEAPFCALRGGSWIARAPLARPVTLPAGMLGRVNLVARLAHLFFDKEGKRAPLELWATPLPLPRELDREGYVTMSFLRAGGASVFGFNQQPTARTFAPTWWGQDGASIGIMFGDPTHTGTPDRTPDRSIDTASSPWALYRLIERGKVVDDTVVWTLPGDGFKRRTVPVRFVLRGNAVTLRPWTLFGSSRD